jgi:hypothetical protein
MAERYGSARPRRRVLALAVGALLVGALLVWAIWAAWLQGTPAIRADLTAYDVVGTHEVRVKVAASFRDDHAGGSCLIRATAEDHTVVGELNLTADQLRAAQGSWIPVRTERRATTAALVRCTD